MYSASGLDGPRLPAPGFDVDPRGAVGGSTERGNHTPYAEFNTFAEPVPWRWLDQVGNRSP